MTSHNFEHLPSNPGSYNDFLEATGLEPGPGAIVALSAALDIYKQDLIEARGLSSLEELHSSPLKLVGVRVDPSSLRS